MIASVKSRRGNKSCCVVNCTNNFHNAPPGTHFYTFPVAKHKLVRRQQWIIAVKRKNPDGSWWTPTIHSRICSHHFVGNEKSENPLSPSYNPTIFPDIYRKKPTAIESVVKRYERNMKRQKILENEAPSGSAGTLQPTDVDDQEIPDILPGKIDKQTQVYFETVVHDFGDSKVFVSNRLVENNICHAETQTYIPDKLNYPPLLKRKKTADKSCGQEILYVSQAVGPDVEDLDPSKLLKCKSGFHGVTDIKSDREMLDLAGVTLSNFNLLLKILSTAPRLKISKENTLLIFLFKMKSGLTYSALAVLFGVHRTTVSRIFITTLQYLTAACQNFIVWPSKEIVQATMPPAFKDTYKDCRVIIDCTEIPVEQPTTVSQRVQLYSHYKKGFTAKILVGCTPAGFVCYISKCFGGRTSDSQITNRSGFLELLEPGDMVLADKGFPGIKSSIDENGKGILIVMPPFLHNHVFSAAEVEETHRVASVRIHIERIMQRLKTFRILNKFTLNMLPFADDIVFMCGVLVNLQPPIIKESDAENLDG